MGGFWRCVGCVVGVCYLAGVWVFNSVVAFNSLKLN